jgi:hypothetical protein
MQWEARDYSEWQGAFKQEPSILSAAIEDAMKGAVPLAFAIQQSAECPLRVMSDALGRRRSSEDVRYASNSDRIAAPRWTVAMGQQRPCTSRR